ncbi:MAG: glycosyltransferase family 2 protein [Dehalococcoidia bacterium]|nr:glycosyltransferase family 2 protein [Dehalococcoidia bacterium]
MKISIISPVFNDVRVARALDSILSQRHEHDLELIVVDAASTDGTMEVLRRYGDRITTLISEPDNGIYDGMNKGIRHATGDVVGILNADDRYADEYVLRDVAEMFADEDVEACYGNLVYVNHNDEIVRYWKTGRTGLRKWYWGWMPPHPTFFVRRRIYDEYGDFNLGFPIAADYELMLRLFVRQRISVKYLDRILVRMALGGESNGSISNIIKANSEVARAWRLNGLRGGFLVPFLKPASKIFQFVGRPR